jgi:small-conductance mechanosensitive channel
MDKLTETLQDTINLGSDAQTKLWTSAALIVILLLVHWLIVKIVWRRTDDVHVRYRSRKVSESVAVILGLLLIGRVWFREFQSLVTIVGLLSAGLAIALKDLVVNLAGWIFILIRRPFELGDRIQIGNHAGDVIDLRIFQFTLLEIGNWVDADQSTGRVIHVPNGKVFTEAVANYGKGFQYIWNEVPVLITFESNWEKAKEILLRIAKEHAEHLSEAAQKRVKESARKFLIFYTKLTPTVYTSVRESGVLLTIRYLCEPRRRRVGEQAIWEDILREFGKCDDIDFAYPTRRFYDGRLEGKKGKGHPSPPLS